MPVFVTGGTGLVGANLIRSLVADGESVRALIRENSKKVGLEDLDLEFVVGDVTDRESLKRGIAGCDRAYHVAGWVRITPWGMDEARAVNVDGTRNVCQACVENNVQRLVHTSSIAAVGHGPKASPANEECVWNLGELGIPYYNTKHEGERVVHEFVNRGLDAVIVNPSYVVGPFDVKPSGGRVIQRIATGRLPGYPASGGIGFVDVREVVEGMRLAMDRGTRGARYILNGENLSYAEFAHLAAKVAGVDSPTRAAKYWMLYLPAVIASWLGRLKPESFADFNIAALRAGFCEHYVNSEKSRRELGVKQRPIEQAIRDALVWFRENGYLPAD